MYLLEQDVFICQEEFRLSTVAGARLGPGNPLINRIVCRPVLNDQMEGGRILWNAPYIQYAAMTKGEAQRSRSRCSTAW